MPDAFSFNTREKVCHIAELPDFSRQCEQIKQVDCLGPEEGGSFSSLEFAFLGLLQTGLRTRPEQIQKFYLPLNHKATEYKGEQYTIAKRTCLWTGKSLLILSESYQSEGSNSAFRRAFKVPDTNTEVLQFYAFVTCKPKVCDQPSRFPNSIDVLQSEYEIAHKANQFFYPYLRPNLIAYHIGEAIKFPGFLIQSIGGWATLHSTLGDGDELLDEGFLAIMGWFLSALILQKESCLHRDLSDKNVVVFGPGVYCQLIDWNSACYLGKKDSCSDYKPRSAYPDFCAPNGVFDYSSDVFSMAMNLLWIHAIHEQSHFFSKVNDLFEFTNKHFGSHSEEKYQRYAYWFGHFQQYKPNASYRVLFQHLLTMAHCERDKRSTIWDLFSDTDIMYAIYQSITSIMNSNTYASWFVDVGELKCQVVIAELLFHAHKQSIAVTSILLLLVYGLHCKSLPEVVRIDSMRKMEALLATTPISFSSFVLMDHYAGYLPGRKKCSLVDYMLEQVIGDVILLFINEWLDGYSDIQAVVDCLCHAVDVSELAAETVSHSVIGALIESAYDETVEQLCNATLTAIIDNVIDRDECESTLHQVVSRVDAHFKQRDHTISDILDDVIHHALIDVAMRNASRNVHLLERGLLALCLMPLLLFPVIDSVDTTGSTVSLGVLSSLWLSSVFLLSTVLHSQDCQALPQLTCLSTVGLFTVKPAHLPASVLPARVMDR